MLARQRKRIDDVGGNGGDGRQIYPLQLFVEESDVERGVVDDPLGALRKLDKFVHDIGELRLVAQHFPGETVNIGCTGVDLPLGVKVKVNMSTGRPAVNEFDAGDLDDPVALLGVQPGRLGV